VIEFNLIKAANFMLGVSSKAWTESAVPLEFSESHLAYFSREVPGMRRVT
jgi:hypothetical protein